LRPSRLFFPPGTYFLTFRTWNYRRLFQVENYARLFLKTLFHYRREGRYLLHAFVVMPDHVHLLLTPAADVTIERAVQLIKGSYSHELGALIGRKSEIWQRGFTDHRIRDAQDFAHHWNYIHQNPVAGGLVLNASEYRYCSAYPGFKLDPWPPAAKAAVVGDAAIGTSGTRALPGLSISLVVDTSIRPSKDCPRQPHQAKQNQGNDKQSRNAEIQKQSRNSQRNQAGE